MPDDMRNNMKVYEIEKEARERRLLAYADAIQRRTLGESSQIIKELVEERHRIGMTQQNIADFSFSVRDGRHRNRKIYESARM